MIKYRDRKEQDRGKDNNRDQIDHKFAYIFILMMFITSNLSAVCILQRLISIFPRFVEQDRLVLRVDDVENEENYDRQRSQYVAGHAPGPYTDLPANSQAFPDGHCQFVEHFGEIVVGIGIMQTTVVKTSDRGYRSCRRDSSACRLFSTEQLLVVRSFEQFTDGEGDSCPTSCTAVVKECPARSERAIMVRASGKCSVNDASRCSSRSGTACGAVCWIAAASTAKLNDLVGNQVATAQAVAMPMVLTTKSETVTLSPAWSSLRSRLRM